MLRAVLPGVCGTLMVVLAAGCGESRHQDAGEPRGSYTVAVTHAIFPLHQAVSRPTQLVLVVRNTSARTVPDVTVAVSSFSYLSTYPHLASRRRPVWVVDTGPGRIANPSVETQQVDPQGSGTTANDDIWALGPLRPGATRAFVWHVTPVKPGLHRIFYRVSAGLNGRSRAQLAGGGISGGSFAVSVAGRPPPTHVDPETGKVVAGPYVPSEAG